MAECDGEIENLKQMLNNYSAEFSPEHVSREQVADLPSLQVGLVHSSVRSSRDSGFSRGV